VFGVPQKGLAVDQPGEVEGIAHVRMPVVVAQQCAAAAGYHRPLTLQRQVDGHRSPRRDGGGCQGDCQEDAEGQHGEVADGSHAAGGHERQRGESQGPQLDGDGGLLAGDPVGRGEEDAGVERKVGKRPQRASD
jgi:hypothetical protein